MFAGAKNNSPWEIAEWEDTAGWDYGVHIIEEIYRSCGSKIEMSRILEYKRLECDSKKLCVMVSKHC